MHTLWYSPVLLLCILLLCADKDHHIFLVNRDRELDLSRIHTGGAIYDPAFPIRTGGRGVGRQDSWHSMLMVGREIGDAGIEREREKCIIVAGRTVSARQYGSSSGRQRLARSTITIIWHWAPQRCLIEYESSVGVELGLR